MLSDYSSPNSGSNQTAFACVPFQTTGWWGWRWATKCKQKISEFVKITREHELFNCSDFPFSEFFEFLASVLLSVGVVSHGSGIQNVFRKRNALKLLFSGRLQGFLFVILSVSKHAHTFRLNLKYRYPSYERISDLSS